MARMRIILLIGCALLISGYYDVLSAAEQKSIRAPHVAGQFYPGMRAELETVVRDNLAQAVKVDLNGPLCALVAPHAGYIYSGPIAAYAYKQIGRPFQRVVILASNHSRYADFEGISVPEYTYYETPLGQVQVSPIAQEWLQQEQISFVPEAHTTHIIEVHLPFLQMVLPEGFEILPIITGRLNWQDVQHFGELLNTLVDDSTLFIVSTDLSHYHPYEEAVQLDMKCITAIEQLETSGVAKAELCGQGAALIFLDVAKQQRWQGEILNYRNSGDTAGDKNRVVGYAAIAFYAPQKDVTESSSSNRLTETEQGLLLELAASTIEVYINEGKVLEPDLQRFSAYPKLLEERGAFVTLKEHGQLRGCIGSIIGRQPLYLGVRDNAIQAAARDPRFEPVSHNELAQLTLSVSVLDVPTRFQVNTPEEYLTALTHQDGVIIMNGDRSATYLPQVWKELPEPETFLSNLCRKAGSSIDCWRDPHTQVYTYRAQEFGKE